MSKTNMSIPSEDMWERVNNILVELVSDLPSVCCRNEDCDGWHPRYDEDEKVALDAANKKIKSLLQEVKHQTDKKHQELPIFKPHGTSDWYIMHWDNKREYWEPVDYDDLVQEIDQKAREETHKVYGKELGYWKKLAEKYVTREQLKIEPIPIPKSHTYIIERYSSKENTK